MTDGLEAKLRAAGVADTEVGRSIRSAPPSGPGDATLPAGPLAALSAQPPAGDPSDAAGLAPLSADFETSEVIGEGGMGRVLLARQHSLAREVAIKTARFPDDAAASAALLVESVVTGRLEHPGIVPVHAICLDQHGQPAIVMKRIEGVPWRDLAQDPDHVGWDGWEGAPDDRLPGHLQILSQVCNAVHFAHSRGVVHRDIKLDNVLIGRFGDVYLADWGIATEIGTQSERVCGTPGYMAPEMVSGAPVDARTDVYLLGATLHEILTGCMRHTADDAIAAIVAASQSAPYVYKPDVATELVALVNEACHVDPDQRPATAQALRSAVARYVEHRQAAALARESGKRLERLEALLKPDGDPTSPEVDRLIAQANFGFERALADWQGDDAALGARARLAAIVERRRARAAALEQQAYDSNPLIGTRARVIALLSISVGGLMVSAYAQATGFSPSRAELVGYPAVLYVAVLAMTIVFRRQLLENALSRRYVAFAHTLFLFMIAQRLLSLAQDVTAADVLSRDSLMLAAGFAVAALSLGRWLAALAACFFACFAATVLWPERALLAYAISSAVATFIAAGLQWATLGDAAKHAQT